MDSIVFRVNADNVGPNLAESVKAYFGSQRVQITVRLDETTADTATIEKMPDLDYALPYDDIARIADALDRDEPIDIAAEMKKFMVAK